MNFVIMFKQNIKLNLDQYFTYIFSLIVSIVFFFIQSSLYNSYILIGNKNIFIVPSIGVFNTAFWGIFIHISFIKLRQKEFKIFLALGMTHTELKILTFLESILVFFISVPIGLALGRLLSKIVGLLVLKLVGISTFTFQFNSIIYPITILYYAALTIIFILFTFKFINNISALNMISDENLYKVNSKKENALEILMLIIVLCYICLNENNLLHYYIRSDKKAIVDSTSRYYLNSSFICMIIVFILFLIFVNFFIAFVRKNSTLYYKRILLINELNNYLKYNKITIFFITFLNFLFIISKRIYYLPNLKRYFDSYFIFQQFSFYLIYLFTMFLSFIISINITYFKSKIDFYNWQYKKIKLYEIGLLDEEIDSILIYKLRLIFFLPVFLTTLASIIYIYILNIDKEFIIDTFKILLCYFTIQLFGYFITKVKIIKNPQNC